MADLPPHQAPSFFFPFEGYSIEYSQLAQTTAFRLGESKEADTLRNEHNGPRKICAHGFQGPTQLEVTIQSLPKNTLSILN